MECFPGPQLRPPSPIVILKFISVKNMLHIKGCYFLQVNPAPARAETSRRLGFDTPTPISAYPRFKSTAKQGKPTVFETSKPGTRKYIRLPGTLPPGFTPGLNTSEKKQLCIRPGIWKYSFIIKLSLRHAWGYPGHGSRII